MPYRTKKLICKVTVLALLLLAVAAYWKKDELLRLLQRRRPVPVARTADEAAVSADNSQPAEVRTESTQSVDPPRTERMAPESYNLKVPFSSQAPFAVWDHRDEEACEEASLLMAHRYYEGRGIDGPSDARQAIDEIIEWEKANLGGVWESTTAEELLAAARGMLGYKQAYITRNPSVRTIKEAVSSGHPVLAPAAGRQLKNPFYKQPGPLYHMLVIKGYDGDEFITNDPGTRRGADYRYKFGVVLDANHDWNDGDVGNGAKVMIVLK